MVKVAFDTVESADRPAATKGKAAKQSKSTGKSRWFLKFSALLLIAIAAAPSMLTLTGSAPAVLEKLHPKLAHAVTFGDVQLHWWARVEVANLRVLDLSQPQAAAGPVADSAVLCEAERISTIEPLWQIALNAGRGTGVVVRSPRLSLIADEQGTNIDRTITEIFGKQHDTSAGRFPFRVTIENGSAQLRSESFFPALDAAYTSAAIESELATKPDPHQKTVQQPVIAEVTSISGTFSTMDTSRWLPAMKLSASIRQSDAQHVAKRNSSRPTRLAAGLDELTNDFPDVPLEELVGTDTSGDADAARIQIYLQPNADDKGRQAIQIGARDVDLRLIQPFLSMLGIEVLCHGMISGGVDARLAGAELADGLVGKIMLAGDNVRIRQPAWATDEWLPLGTVNASGAIAMAQDGLLIQDLNFSTSVAKLTGNGELRHRQNSTDRTASPSQQVELTGNIDMARVASSLPRTLSLHEDVSIQNGSLIFKAVASANATVDSGNSITDTSSGSQSGSWTLVTRVDGLQAIRDGKPINVDSSLQMDAVGPFAAGVPQLLRARLTAGFGTIDCVPDGEAWKISGLVQPTLLWETVQQFADVTQPGIRGDVNFQSRVSVLPDSVALTELQLNSSDVRASSQKLTIFPSNPVMSMLDGDVHLEGTGSALRTLLRPWFEASVLAGRAQVVANLTVSPQSEILLAVRVTPAGIAAISESRFQTVSQSRTQLTSAPASIFVIDEADINLSMTASNEGRQFRISNGTIKLPGLVSQVSGTVSIPNDETLLDLTADTSYDLDLLSRRLFAADSGLAFSGQGRDVFKLNGNPAVVFGDLQKTTTGAAAARILEGSGTLQWASAKILGLSVGGAAVPATLENSFFRAGPLQCELNGGRLNAMGQYDLATSRLQLGAGSRVENVRLNPELCREWLGFVAPMLADTADVNGQLSMRVERFLWDLNAPQNSDVSGQLTIHEASATPGSSFASLLQVVDLLRQRDSADGSASKSLTLPEQTVPVQVRQGYVIHDGLIMDLAGYRLKSAGAVGMNEQLQITLDVPLEKGTTGNIRTIKVPLRGSIKSPQPDTAALIQNLGIQKLQEQLGTDKIQQKLESELDQTLNKRLNK
ncbi:MAG: hypothetical protein KDB01_25410, partial [Planctomycetaceae bacterium]|nr:hypothetical protein [Planctomycetaceae bacterium]